MNEKFSKLADQCRNLYRDGNGQYVEQFDEEKFSELILTEVISTIYRSDISDKKQEKLVDELAYKFGLK